MVSMSKTQLTIRQNINQTTIWPNFMILPERTSRIFKKMCIDFAKSISGNRISNFKTFGTTRIFLKKRRPYRSKPVLLNQ